MMTLEANASVASKNKVFISYCRRDKLFVQKLCQALTDYGHDIWVDWEDIPPSSDWRAEIQAGIEAADVVVFVLSPDWMASQECDKELKLAERYNKRLLPIVYRDVQYSEVAPSLASINWIFVRETDSFATGLELLLGAIATDLEYVRLHTRLLERALEWDKCDRDASFLLRGTDLQSAEAWLMQSATLDPKPTGLQSEYLFESRNYETARQQTEIKRQRIALIGISAALLAAIGLGTVAFNQYRAAQRQNLVAQSRTSEALSTSNQPFEALLAALQAGTELQENPWVGRNLEIQAEVATALLHATYAVREQNRLTGHGDTVHAVAWSPDGQTLASGSEDGTVRLWQRDGTPLFTVTKKQPIWDVTFSPNAQRLAIARQDGGVELLNREGVVQRTFVNGDQAAYAVEFSPDNQFLAIGGADGSLKLWRSNGLPVATLTGHQAAVRSVSFSPDGQQLASAGEDGTVRLWDRDGKPLLTFSPQAGRVLAVKFSADGQQLATGQADGTVRLWDRQGKLLKVLEGHRDRVWAVSFSADGQQIASAGDDHTIRLWRQDGTSLATLTGHSLSIFDVAFHPKEPVLASASADLTVRLWQSQSPLLTAFHKNRKAIWSIEFSPLASSSVGKAPSPGNQSLLLSAGEDGIARIWQPNGALVAELVGHLGQIWEATFSPDGKTIATAGVDGTVRLWQRDGNLLQVLNGQRGSLYSVSFSPDSSLIATAGVDHTVRLWDRQGQLLNVYAGHSSPVYDVKFSPDGQTFASVDEDGTLIFWRREGILHSPITTDQGRVGNLAFSPDGRVLATSGSDGTVKLWSREGVLLKTLLIDRAHELYGVEFSPDGQMLAVSGLDDAAINLYRLDGTRIVALKGHKQGVAGLSFSADSRTLASSGLDGTVMVWDLQRLSDRPIEHLMTAACTWAQDYLRRNPQPFLTHSSCQGVLPSVRSTLFSY